MRAIPHNESHSSIYNKWGISLLLNVVGKDERMGCIVKIREYEYECVFVMCFVAFVVLSRDCACVLLWCFVVVFCHGVLSCDCARVLLWCFVMFINGQ